VDLTVSPLQSLRNHRCPTGKIPRRSLSPSQHRRRKPTPFLALPVQPLHGDGGLFSQQPWKKRKQRRPQSVIVDYVIGLGYCVGCAQQRVNQGFQMLRSDRRQPHYPHPVVFRQRRREVIAAIHRNVMSHLRQPFPHFFVISLNPAIFRDHAAPADKCYPQCRSRLRRDRSLIRSGGPLARPLRRDLFQGC